MSDRYLPPGLDVRIDYRQRENFRDTKRFTIIDISVRSTSVTDRILYIIICDPVNCVYATVRGNPGVTAHTPRAEATPFDTFRSRVVFEHPKGFRSPRIMYITWKVAFAGLDRIRYRLHLFAIRLSPQENCPRNCTDPFPSSPTRVTFNSTINWNESDRIV